MACCVVKFCLIFMEKNISDPLSLSDALPQVLPLCLAAFTLRNSWADQLGLIVVM